jgi:hypothetical protein
LVNNYRWRITVCTTINIAAELSEEISIEKLPSENYGQRITQYDQKEKVVVFLSNKRSDK